MSVGDDGQVGSDRLRRAIERNRAKQAKRLGRGTTSTSRPPIQRENRPSSFGGRIGPRRSRSSGELELSQREHQGHQEHHSIGRPLPPMPQRGLSRGGGLRRGGFGPSAATNASTVTPREAMGERSFSSPRKMSKWGDYALKAAWIFCGLLILRLVFTSGGVIDFYSKRNQYVMKQKELGLVKRDSHRVAADIVKLKHDATYQKKLIRKHLGFISSDEYVILFEK